ncbi:MAG: alcohol dehydrogenase [Acetobacteraceae bacterium]|nr:alcohol dehydrogenase [Acetobacteraceae bacterium]
MRAAVFHRPGQPLSIEDRQTPAARPGDIVIKVAFCGICGSDLHATEPGPTSLETGTVLGHEYSGVVTESASGDFRPGDRVIGLPLQECDDCRPSGQGCKDRLGIHCPRNRIIGLGAAVPGAYAEYVRMPAHHAMKIPDGLDLKHAALTEPLAVGAHAVRLAGNLLGARVLVIGAGPIGLAVAVFAQVAGAREVVVSEVAKGRRDKAASLGASVIDPAVTKPAPAEVIFECVGVPGVLRQCMDLAPSCGQIVVVGVCRGEDTIFPRVAIRKELRLQFVLGYTREEFALALDLLASGRIDAAPLITGVVGLDLVPEMFEALRKPGDHAKVLIDPSM